MASLSTTGPRPALGAPPRIALRVASDARLTKLAAAGSEGAMAAIFERHHQALHRYCYAIVGNEHDAADALQNTMLKALRALPGETRQIALRPWLYRIAHNESISLLRSRRPDSDLDAASYVGDSAVAGAIESRDRLRSLTEDLRELTERQRGSLLMRELGGMEFAEIAEALQTSAPAAKQSVYEARCALQAMRDGRAMDCDAVQRSISDGDRRVLRGMRMRGHLRDCTSCRAFELSMRERSSQLNALIPALPAAVAAGILHAVTGTGGSTGGGVAAAVAGGAKATAGLSLTGKAAIAVAVGATLAGGGAAAVPALRPASSEHPAAPPVAAAGAGARDGVAPAAIRAAEGRSSRRAATTKASVDLRGRGTVQRAAARTPTPASSAAVDPAATPVHGAAASGRQAGAPGSGRGAAGKRSGRTTGKRPVRTTGKSSRGTKPAGRSHATTRKPAATGTAKRPAPATAKPAAGTTPGATSHPGSPSAGAPAASSGGPSAPGARAGTSAGGSSGAGAAAGTGNGAPVRTGSAAATPSAPVAPAGAP